MNLLKYKNDLESDKSFRDSEMQRLLVLRRESENFNTISVCNLVLNYIYDLNFKSVFNQNNKNA